jgi:hypothetical protein
VVTDPGAASGDAGTAGPSTGSSGDATRSTRPAPSRPDNKGSAPGSETTPPDTTWFDAASLTGGLLGLPAAGSEASSETSAPDAVLEATLTTSRDHSTSSSSLVLLGVSVLILLALLGGVAFRWWDRRPGRYWPA